MLEREPGEHTLQLIRHLAAASVALLLACGDKGPDGAMQMHDSSGVTIAFSDPAQSSSVCTVSATPTVAIGGDSGAKEYMFDRVFGATRLSDGRIVIVNQGTQQIRFFDASGKYLMSSGRGGDGPGEFHDAFFLWALPGDTIWVGDDNPWRYLVFAPDGKYQRTVVPDPLYVNSPTTFGMLQDGRSVHAQQDRLFVLPDGFRSDSLEVRVHKSSGEQERVLGKYVSGQRGKVEGYPTGPSTFPLFESFAHMAVGADRIALWPLTGSEVRVVSPEGALIQLIRWNSGDLSVRQGDVEEYRKKEIETGRGMTPAQYKLYVEPQIDEKRPVAKNFPAVADMMYGRDGRLWLRMARRPTVTGPPSWLVFEENGEFACRAETPAKLEVYEFGSDYVLGLMEGDDGAERVAMFAISGTGRR